MNMVEEERIAMTDPTNAAVTIDELRLATRNHGMPLEALLYDVTPVGLHYLLIHYDIPMIDAARWRLSVEGRVNRPIELSLEDLRAMPSVTRAVTMECAGNGRALLEPRPLSQPWLTEAVGTGRWTGVALPDLLSRAGLAPDAVEVLFTGADHGVEADVEQTYQRSIPVSAAVDHDVLLAYALNDAPLPPQHGFPLRLIVPGWYGMTNVKWLTTITAVDTPFDGHQQAVSYRLRQRDDEQGEPLTRILPRALMVPPGIPDFLTRVRYLTAGDHQLVGRAWSGVAPVTAVAVSSDGGNTWRQARVHPPSASGVWQSWSYAWHAEPGSYELCCRAVDATGTPQPTHPEWNLGGYANNAIQRIPVRVNANRTT
jgi:DMSO/TMAO reductase YedYZ molybdopterin-dependent catalytic subunit